MSKKKEKRKDLRARPSRKTYLMFYLMCFALAGFLFYLNKIGKDVGDIPLAAAIVFVFLGINITETHRMNNLYEIGEYSLVCTYGIFNKTIKKVDYFAISDVIVKQNFLQWILGFGDVEVRLFSNDVLTAIKNINKPSEFGNKIEDSIAKRRNSSS